MYRYMAKEMGSQPVIRAGNMDTTNNSEASGAAQNITMSKKFGGVVIGDLNWIYAYSSKMIAR